MNLDISVKNYRCFNESHPPHLPMHRGTTALIGTNNAGKSTFLRLFYEFRPLFRLLSEKTEVWLDLLNESLPCPDLPDHPDHSALFHRQSTGDLVISIRMLDCDCRHDDSPPPPAPIPQEIDLILSRRNFRWRARVDGDRGRFQTSSGPHGNALLIGGQKSAVTISWKFLHDLFASLTDTFYIGPYRSLHPGSGLPRSYDLHLDAMEVSRGFPTGPDRQRLEQEMATIFQFDSFHLLQPQRPSDPLFEINGQNYLPDELGSGIGQVFLMLSQSSRRRPAYIFIDEPECHLHPAIQGDFITALNGYARKALFLATHSMGLARMVADRMLQVSRSPSHTYSVIRPYRGEERLSEVMGEINFSLQQQAGCRKVLLVEGPTEVKTIRQFLRHLGHDRQVIILPLGGSSMINSHRDDELQEIARICPDVYALVDSEKNSPHAPLSSERRGFLQSCTKAGITCHVLERRAIENYFTRPAIQSVLGRGFRELAEFDDVKQRFSHWPKAENWKIVRAMQPADFSKTDLGQFLTSVLQAPCRVPPPDTL